MNMIMFFLYFFPLFFQFIISEQYIEVSGSSYERGEQLGTKMKSNILQIYHQKLLTYSKYLSYWEEISEKSLKTIETYAPESYQEMLGMSNVDGLSMKIISMMNTDNEIWLSTNPHDDEMIKKTCTGFTSFHGKEIITGQTDDENSEVYFKGIYDYVVKMDEECLIFTRGGMLTFMGMNKWGLVLLWQTIDNGERNFDEFLPTTVITREILRKKSLQEVIEYLKNIPKAVPNNFIVSKTDEGFVDIEYSSTNFTVNYTPLVSNSDLCHANDILFSQPMMDGQTFKDPTSPIRFAKCREMMLKFRQNGGIDRDKALQLLMSPPIQRNASLGTMLFIPEQRKMLIKFFLDDRFFEHNLN